MEAASLAVRDSAAKYREELLYNRYQAARDNVEGFRKEPPFAYVIARKQRDLPEAATLVEKLMVNGIEVHEAVQPFHANGRDYPPGTWVVLMDQPFSPPVNELFEPQQYPELRETPSSPPRCLTTSPGGRCRCRWACKSDRSRTVVALSPRPEADRKVHTAGRNGAGNRQRVCAEPPAERQLQSD
jgi:hypothetical protein